MNPSDDPAASASGEGSTETVHPVMEVLWNHPRRTAAKVCEAAAMALPVHGKKSIIHRLANLAMSNLSPRRCLAGRTLLGAGLLALPLTFSITYAAAEAQVQMSEPTPPAPPQASEAMQPIALPAPPAIFIVERSVISDRIAITDGERKITEHVWRDVNGRERRVVMVMHGGLDRMVLSRMLGGEHYY